MCKYYSENLQRKCATVFMCEPRHAIGEVVGIENIMLALSDLRFHISLAYAGTADFLLLLRRMKTYAQIEK